jgi:hypothetical protein
VSYKIYQFGTMVLPNYNADQDIGLEAPSKYAALPWGGAFDYLGGEKARPGGYKLNKPCTLLSEVVTTFQAAKEELQSEYNALKVLVGSEDKLYRLRFADGVMEWAWARLEGIKGTRKSGDILTLSFTLEFYIESPCWYSTTMHAYDWHIVGIAPADTLLTTLAESKGAAVKYIDNTSNIDQPAALFTLTAISTVTSVIINNTTTGYSFSYTGTLAAGDTLVIDTGAMSVKKNGVDAYSLFVPPANHEEWMHIAPGENKLTINITGGGRLALEYYAAFA